MLLLHQQSYWSFQISAIRNLVPSVSRLPALLVGRGHERSLQGYMLKVTYLGNEKSSQSLGPTIQMNANKEKRDEIEDDENKNHEQDLWRNSYLCYDTSAHKLAVIWWVKWYLYASFQFISFRTKYAQCTPSSMSHSFIFIKKQSDHETCQAAFYRSQLFTRTILDRPKIFFLWRKRVFNLIFLYETFLCKAEFTRGTRALLPG